MAPLADKCAALQINNRTYNDKAIISPQAIIMQLAHYYLTSHNQPGTLCTKALMLHGLWAEIFYFTTGGRWSALHRLKSLHTGQYGLKSLYAKHVIPTFD